MSRSQNRDAYTRRVMSRLHAHVPRSRVVQVRIVVLAVAIGFAVIKLIFAARTPGTNDVTTFQGFADAIRHYGPINIYGHRIPVPSVPGAFLAPYNHPPLVGWMLVVFNRLTDLGIPFRFLIRVPATLADVVTSMLVFELVRGRRPLGEAAVAGLVVASSPALVVISGYHGNTDPVFVMFALASLYLLVNERSGFVAGLAFAAAINIKIVPIVTLPVLLLVAARSSRRRLLAFLAGSGALLAVTWGPVVPHRWTAFKENVLGYKGLNYPQWGLVQFARTLGFSTHWQEMLRGGGRYPLLLLSAGVPLLIAWRWPTASTSAFGLSLVAVLLLSTSTAARYVVWAVAAVFLVNVWAGVIYNVAASALLIVVYDSWNGGALPWNWGHARSGPWTHGEVLLAGIVWLTLLAVFLIGLLPPEKVDLRRVMTRRRTRERQRTGAAVLTPSDVPA